MRLHMSHIFVRLYDRQTPGTYTVKEETTPIAKIRQVIDFQTLVDKHVTQISGTEKWRSVARRKCSTDILESVPSIFSFLCLQSSNCDSSNNLSKRNGKKVFNLEKKHCK